MSWGPLLSVSLSPLPPIFPLFLCSNLLGVSFILRVFKTFSSEGRRDNYWPFHVHMVLIIDYLSEKGNGALLAIVLVMMILVGPARVHKTCVSLCVFALVCI